MATELLVPPVPACYLAPATPRIKIKNWRTISATHLRINSSLNREYPFRFRPVSSIKVANQSSGLVEREKVAKIKTELYQAIQGINKGIFGLPSAKKSEIEDLVKLLESQNPTPEPTKKLETVDGSWKLVYSTISILGSMRTKLGLRDFVSLGDFFQTIDVKEEKAINVIKFSVRGLKMLTGELTIVASFKIASNSRVDIKLENSTIEPDQLMNIFRKNYESLLTIFNPEGWLEISYVDESLRIGRDGKGNIFVLERSG